MASSPTARLMDGTDLARRIVAECAAAAADLRTRTGVIPTLATVLVGDDPASVTYVRMKRRRCEQAGIRSRHLELPASVSTAELVDTLTTLSHDPEVHGILLQHPVGAHIDERAAFEAIARTRTSTASPCTRSPPWGSASPGSWPARRAASSA